MQVRSRSTVNTQTKNMLLSKSPPQKYIPWPQDWKVVGMEKVIKHSKKIEEKTPWSDFPLLPHCFPTIM